MDDNEEVVVQATRPVWMLVSGLFTLIILAGSAWMHHIQAQQDAVEEKVTELKKGEVIHGERLMRIETKVENVEKQQVELKQGQTRIEDKLDTVLRQQETPPAHR